jgi:site-specific recombinase XerD
MQVSKAAEVCLEYHRTNSKENTIKAYEMILTKFCGQFGDRDLYDITTDDALSFLNQITAGKTKQTRKIRYSHMKAFSNFVKNNLDQNFRNPRETPMMKKMFKAKSATKWDIIEKETMDKIIFRTTNVRDRLIMERMARGGMRVGEVLKLTVDDIQDRKLVIRDPNSGKEREYMFIPQKVADRLNEYIGFGEFETNHLEFE